MIGGAIAPTQHSVERNELAGIGDRDRLRSEKLARRYCPLQSRFFASLIIRANRAESFALVQKCMRWSRVSLSRALHRYSRQYPDRKGLSSRDGNGILNVPFP